MRILPKNPRFFILIGISIHNLDFLIKYFDFDEVVFDKKVKKFLGSVRVLLAQRVY